MEMQQNVMTLAQTE